MTAWDQAFELLSTACMGRAAQIVAAGANAANAAKNQGELGEWLRLADCLNAIHENRTLQ